MNCKIPTHFKNEREVRCQRVSTPRHLRSSVESSFTSARPSSCLAAGDWEFGESQEKWTCRDVGHEACSMVPVVAGPWGHAVGMLAGELSS